jgi:ABC-2 type transport system ATP-binding protein
MTAIAICTQDLTCDFKSVRALDHLTLNVESGTIFGFLGTNGAGKTTTIRLLLGLLEPTGGHATVLGYDTHTQANYIREKSGALLEHTGLYERLTALDNLEFYARAWGMERNTRMARIQELLTHFGLWERRQDSVSDWSRGMKQKLALARALLHRPSLVFLDEPTAGLDPVAASALRDDLASLVKNEGITVFLTTHNLNEAEKLCHQVAVIQAGKLLAVGAPTQLITQEAHIQITGTGFTDSMLNMLNNLPDVVSCTLQNGQLSLRLKAGTAIAPLVTLLVTQGVSIEEVVREQTTLEDTFLSLVENH